MATVVTTFSLLSRSPVQAYWALLNRQNLSTSENAVILHLWKTATSRAHKWWLLTLSWRLLSQSVSWFILSSTPVESEEHGMGGLEWKPFNRSTGVKTELVGDPTLSTTF